VNADSDSESDSESNSNTDGSEEEALELFVDNVVGIVDDIVASSSLVVLVVENDSGR